MVGDVGYFLIYLDILDRFFFKVKFKIIEKEFYRNKNKLKNIFYVFCIVNNKIINVVIDIVV